MNFFLVVIAYFADFVELLCGVIPQNYTKSAKLYEERKLLLEGGADVNAATKDGWTALMRAAQEGRVEIAKLLLEAGADVHAADKEGRIALTLAAEKGHMEVVKLLLRAGADFPDADKE